jgi:hypothetical protein
LAWLTAQGIEPAAAPAHIALEMPAKTPWVTLEIPPATDQAIVPALEKPGERASARSMPIHGTIA